MLFFEFMFLGIRFVQIQTYYTSLFHCLLQDGIKDLNNLPTQRHVKH
jgi:hypothetical protein